MTRRYADARRIYNAVKRDGHRVLTLPEIQRVIDAHEAADPAPTDEPDENVGRRMLAEQWRRRQAADPAPTGPVRQMMDDVAAEHARTWKPRPGFRPGPAADPAPTGDQP